MPTVSKETKEEPVAKNCWNCQHVKVGGFAFPCECLLKATANPDTGCHEWKPKPPKIIEPAKGIQ